MYAWGTRNNGRVKPRRRFWFHACPLRGRDTKAMRKFIDNSGSMHVCMVGIYTTATKKHMGDIGFMNFCMGR